MVAQYHWSRSIISAGMSIMVLAYGIGGIFAGSLADRIAPRWIITAGSTLMATGLFLTALIREPWQFYLTCGVFGGFGAACLDVVVCNSSVGKWFVRKRGLAWYLNLVVLVIVTFLILTLKNQRRTGSPECHEISKASSAST